MRKKGVTVVEVLVVIAIVAILITMLVGGVAKLAENQHVRASKTSSTITKSVGYFESSISNVYELHTIKHDNCLFVVYEKGGLLHHPKCPCLQAVTAEQPED